MEIRFANRMNDFQPGIFNVLDDRKNHRLAQGKPVYNLSIGTPDFLPEVHIVEALAQAASDPKNYRYSLSETPELVTAVQDWYRRRYGVELAEEELMSVYGSQEGLTHIGWTMCDPGGIVLVPDPGYPIFELGPYLCGANCIHYPLLAENDYLPDLEHFDPELAKKPNSWWCPIRPIRWGWQLRTIFIPGLSRSRNSIISLSFMITHILILSLTGGKGNHSCPMQVRRKWA